MSQDDSQRVGIERRALLRAPVALAMGASAGGPRALLTLLAGLEVPAPIFAFLVQHIHPKFTHVLVRRLTEVSPFPVQEAEDLARVEPGRLYLAPGGRHLVVERVRPSIYRTRLTEDPPRHGVRPAVDELFASVAEAFGGRVVGVVLTGMGHDGQDGARAIKARGGTVLAEAEATCVVYGMPRALAEAGLADRLVPLDEMAAAIRQACLALLDPLSPPAVPVRE
ncbi:MAG TPA: CheB methylesterase domain-containing protein [Candidatus Acidoferrum sp.]|nr:CheB methylesterase domain-containing protein [Candidatus Acidoferrum sp.]